MDLLTRKFTAQSVALATGVPSKQVTDWCSQGHIIGQREPLGSGRRREFSWFNVMEFGIANALMEIGVRSPSDAFQAAQRFSHTSDGGMEWEGDDALRDNDPYRLPGLPYHHDLGWTYLFLAGSDSDVVLTEDGTVNLHRIKNSSRHSLGCIAVNVTELFTRITNRIALDYREVLDEAYPKAV